MCFMTKINIFSDTHHVFCVNLLQCIWSKSEPPPHKKLVHRPWKKHVHQKIFYFAVANSGICMYLQFFFDRVSELRIKTQEVKIVDLDIFPMVSIVIFLTAVRFCDFQWIPLISGGSKKQNSYSISKKIDFLKMCDSNSFIFVFFVGLR